MRSASILIAGLVCAAFSVDAAAQPAPRTAEERTQYFMEFRARGGGILGHTFVVFGRMDTAGRIVEQNHAGLVPDERFGESPVLAVALVRAEVSLKREDPRKPTLAAYRRKLTAAEYAHLQLTIHRLKASHQRWHMWFYNCNDFAAQVAREMGMIAPFAWMLPASFVRTMHQINR